MRPWRIALAIVLALVGLVWTGQGLGFVPGSFMTGSAIWAVIGGACLIAAGALAWSGVHRASTADWRLESAAPPGRPPHPLTARLAGPSALPAAPRMAMLARTGGRWGRPHTRGPRA